MLWPLDLTLATAGNGCWPTPLRLGVRSDPGRHAHGVAYEGTRMSDRVEARRTPRFKTRRNVRIILPEGEAILGTMQDVSLGGMLVAVPVEVELGRTYRIEVVDSEGVFCLHGEALRLHLPPRSAGGSQGSGFKIGFEFVGTDPAGGERLARLLAEVAA